MRSGLLYSSVSLRRKGQDEGIKSEVKEVGQGEVSAGRGEFSKVVVSDCKQESGVRSTTCLIVLSIPGNWLMTN